MLVKVEEKRRLSKLLADHLANSPEVRPFPAVVTRLLSVCQDPKANAQTFKKVIECDAAVSVRLLRLANSPLFGMASEVKSIAHAVTLLGIRQLRSLAMSIAGASMFSNGSKTDSDHRKQLWRHSIGCANVAKLLTSRKPGISSDDVFIAGVFHDIGKLLFFDVAPEEYSQMCSSLNGKALVEEERFVFSITHEEVGLQSAISWELPATIRSAIGWHHHPQDATDDPAIAELVHHADQLARAWGVGSEPELDSLDRAEASCRAFELTPHEANELFEAAQAQFKVTMDAWSW